MKKKYSSVPPASEVSNHFRKHFSRPSKMSDDLYFEQNLYFITARFDVAPTRQLKSFGKIYYELSKQLVGNHLNRKRKLQPLCYAFVDADGSRSGHSDVFYCEWPHVHALIMPPPKIATDFRKAIQTPQIFIDPSISTFDVQPFCARRGTIEHLVSYCSKGCKQSGGSNHAKEDLWAIFPK
jgi:hypothetical protein